MKPHSLQLPTCRSIRAGCTQAGRQADRRADQAAGIRQAGRDRQTDREGDGETMRQTGRQAGRQADSPDIGDIGTYIHAYTNTLTDGRTQTVKDRQDRYRQTPTDREIARH